MCLRPGMPDDRVVRERGRRRAPYGPARAPNSRSAAGPAAARGPASPGAARARFSRRSRRSLLTLIAGQALSALGVDVTLANPVAQRLRRDAELVGDLRDR